MTLATLSIDRAPGTDRSTPAIDDPSDTVLRDAGIGAGMHVLDAACGDASLALIAGRIVGAQGRVTTLADSSATIRDAMLHAAQTGRSNLRFVRHHGNEFDLDPSRPFDALIGRAALLRLDEPATRLRALLPFVAPGGAVLLQEYAESDAALQALWPITETEFDRLGALPPCSGAERRTALRLSRAFRSVGLLPPQLRLCPRTGRPPGAPLLVSAWSRA
jgi:SAM-dependent methyltransferase